MVEILDDKLEAQYWDECGVTELSTIKRTKDIDSETMEGGVVERDETYNFNGVVLQEGLLEVVDFGVHEPTVRAVLDEEDEEVLLFPGAGGKEHEHHVLATEDPWGNWLVYMDTLVGKSNAGGLATVEYDKFVSPVDVDYESTYEFETVEHIPDQRVHDTISE